VASILDRLCARLQQQGFEDAHLHAHLFRHDYITRKALDGENPSVLKRWVGHRTFAMTDRYFGIAESKLAAVRPKRSVLEGIVALPDRKRGRPAAKPRTKEAGSDSFDTVPTTVARSAKVKRDSGIMARAWSP
jgi:hypothetical protein